MADTNTPLLKTPDGQPATGKPLALPKSGLVLQLELVAGQKLDNATLALQAAGQDESLTATFTTDQGTNWPTQPVNWLIADWGADRLLTTIEVQPTADKVRLKVYTAGAWISLYPIDIIATGAEQRFSPVLASKVMVELVKAGDYPGVWLPNPVQVTGVTLKATSQPYDLSIAVADRPAFFQHSGPLLSAAPLNVEGLVEAVNAYLDEPGHALPIPVRLKAAISGNAQLTFSATTVIETRQLDNTAPDNTLIIPWQEAAVGRIAIGENTQLKALRFTPDVELQPEKLYLAPPSGGAPQAQLCAPQRRLAQGFQTGLQEQEAIAGLDLYLYPRSPDLQAALSLHPDLHGRPGPSPYGGAVIPIRWQGEISPLGRWLSCQFPQPVRLEDENWWIVLDVTQGEVLWALAGAAPTGVNGCLYQIGASAWLPRRLAAPGESSAWAQTRIRVTALLPQSLSAITLRRGSVSVDCAPDAQGRVQVGATGLQTINSSTGPVVEIAITAESAGHVTLRDLRIVWG